MSNGTILAMNNEEENADWRSNFRTMGKVLEGVPASLSRASVRVRILSLHAADDFELACR
eukprot:6186520-Pleurochrysis_carterae.AAC.6